MLGEGVMGARGIERGLKGLLLVGCWSAWALLRLIWP